MVFRILFSSPFYHLCIHNTRIVVQFSRHNLYQVLIDEVRRLCNHQFVAISHIHLNYQSLAFQSMLTLNKNVWNIKSQKMTTFISPLRHHIDKKCITCSESIISWSIIRVIFSSILWNKNDSDANLFKVKVTWQLKTISRVKECKIHLPEVFP